MTEDRVLFKNLNDALLWAWYFAKVEGGIVKGPSYAQFIKSDEQDRDENRTHSLSGISTGRKPTGLDGAAQAGMIKGFVYSLDPVDRCHLMAAMLRAQDRSVAQREMALYVRTHLGDPMPEIGPVTELVRKHYGHKGLSMVAIGKKYNMDRRKVTGIRVQVAITLDAIAYRAEMTAYVRLQKMGVIA